MKIITQKVSFRQAVLVCAEKKGVKYAARKYCVARSTLYFWKNRWDGTPDSLANRSKRPHHHPNEHTPEELKLITDMRRRNPSLGLNELWHRLKKRGYTRRPESLYRVLKRLSLLPPAAARKAYTPSLTSRWHFYC